MSNFKIEFAGPGGLSTIEAALLKEHFESLGAKVTISDPNAQGYWETTLERMAQVKKAIQDIRDQGKNPYEDVEITINVVGYPWGG